MVLVKLYQIIQIEDQSLQKIINLAAVSIPSFYTTNKINVAGNFTNLNGTISVVVREETLLKHLLSKK